MTRLQRTHAGLLALAIGIFSTLGRAEAPAPLRVVFFTDVHARTEWGTTGALARAVAAINAQKPDLVIGGGDYITDGFESSAEAVEPRWAAFLDMREKIAAPFQPALGNHDLVAVAPGDGSPPAADPRGAFREKLGVERTCRSFDFKGWHVILLDAIEVTGDALRYRGFVGPEEMDWLKGDLAALAPDTPIVLVSHMPLMTPFFQATEGPTAAAPANRVVVNSRDVLKLFEGRTLALVLQGHTHVHDAIEWRGTRFVTGGAVCGQWWRGPWHGTEEGFTVVALDPCDRPRWWYVDYGWDAVRPPGE